MASDKDADAPRARDSGGSGDDAGIHPASGADAGNDAARMKRYYEEELARKDRIIEELRKERDILIKTALRQAEKNESLLKRIPGTSAGKKADY
jgi:hypothetical protein